MDQLSAVRTILGKAWISGGPEEEDYWLEGETAEIHIERTDENEIRVGTHLNGVYSEAASIYLSRSEAIRAMLAIAAAVGDR